jgi:hypothetical protein
MVRRGWIVPIVLAFPALLTAQPGEDWVGIGVSRGGTARVSIDRAQVDSIAEDRIYVARVQEDFGASARGVTMMGREQIMWNRRITIVRFDCRARRLRRGASSLYRGTILVNAAADFSADPMRPDLEETISDRDLVAAFCRGEWMGVP